MSNEKINVLMLGPSFDVKGGMTSVEILILENPFETIQVMHIPTCQEGFIGLKIFAFITAIAKILWIFGTRDISSVHIHVSQRGSVFRASILIVLMRLCRKPIIIHTHGSEFRPFYGGLPKILQNLLGTLFRQCHCIIVLSESWKTFYVDKLNLEPRQVLVLPNPVKLPKTLPKRNDLAKVTCLFLGKVGQRKGTFDLIQAFAKLSPQQLANVTLVIAGDGDVERARNLVRQLNLSERVTVTGWVGSEQRDRLLSEADIFALPSFNEGLPMAVLEAMGWGLAVITTPVGGIPEVVTPNLDGLLVDPGNIQQLSDALGTLIDSASIRHALGTEARKRVEPLNIDKYGDKLAELYQAIHDGKP